MHLTAIPAGPLVLIARLLLPDLSSVLCFAGACKSIRRAVRCEVRLCALTRDTASHVADVLLREFSRAHASSRVQLRVRLSPFLRDICAAVNGSDDDDPCVRVVRVSADLRRHVVRVEARFHALHALEPLGDAANGTDLELRLTGPMSGVCAGRVMLTSDDGNRRLRNAFGAVACAPVVAAPFADGPVRALRALGVLVGRWPAHL